MKYFLYRSPYYTEFTIEVSNEAEYPYHYNGIILDIKDFIKDVDYDFKVGDMFFVAKGVCVEINIKDL